MDSQTVTKERRRGRKILALKTAMTKSAEPVNTMQHSKRNYRDELKLRIL